MYSGSLTLFSVVCFLLPFRLLSRKAVLLLHMVANLFCFLKITTSSFLEVKYSKCVLGVWKSQQTVILKDGTAPWFYTSTLILHMMLCRQKPVYQEASTANGPASSTIGKTAIHDGTEMT